MAAKTPAFTRPFNRRGLLRCRCACGETLRMSEAALTSIEVGTGTGRPPHRGAAARRRARPACSGSAASSPTCRAPRRWRSTRWAAEQGRACIRFDYSGHGESGGAFTDGTIGRWLEESAAVFERFAKGPQVLIGSSMGGWLALLLARELKRRSRGRPASVGRPGADRAGGRFHRRADVEAISRPR